MNSTRTTTGNVSAESKKSAVSGPAAFAAKAPLVDKLGPEDIQRALFNEYEMGCVQPVQRGFSDIPLHCYDHHLF